MAIDFTTPLGQVRLLIADVDEGNEVLTDPMLEGYLLLTGDNVRLAAAQALDAIAVSETLVSKVMTTLDVTTNGAVVANALRAAATELRRQVSEGLDGGGDFDIANIVVDKHTAVEQLIGSFEREGSGWWPYYLGEF